ncbi:MAG: hypothetical protein RIT27_807 [Pseudomonadota bacterium]|jgi:hypothetical protein
MKTHPLIYFSDTQLIIYQIVDKSVLEVQRFSTDEQGQVAFEKWLPISSLQAWYQPISIVVDSRQEEYFWERVPHVSIHDRKELLQLRCRRCFPNTPYSFAYIQGKSPQLETTRLEDQALCIGLPQPDSLQLFVTILLKNKIAIRGIYSLPLLVESITSYLPTARYTLLITHTEPLNQHQPFALKQIFLIQNQLILSRWISFPQQEVSFSTFLMEEIHKTRQYLLGINVLSHEHSLNVLIFSEQTYLNEIENIKKNISTGITIQSFNAAKWIVQQGIRKSPPIIYFYSLIFQQLVKKSPSNHYAKPFELRYFKYFKLRQMLQLSTAVILIMSSLFAGYIMLKSYETEQQTQQLEEKLANMNTLYQQTKALQPVDIDVLALKDTVDGTNWLSRRQRFPIQSFSIISEYLVDFPQLSLEKLSWSYKEEVSQSIGGENSNSKIQQLLQAKRKEAGLDESKFLDIVMLEGKILPFNGNAEQALETIRNFEQHLKKNKHIKDIKELVLPLNLSPTNTVKGNLTHSNTQTKEAPFSLEITLNIP